MAKIIFHIDIDSFYASAEVTQNPSLKGKPIAVAGKKNRGIITTASYEARKYGVSSAMPIFQALKQCPQLILVKVNFELYRKLSHQFFEIIKKYSQEIEIVSIDECYVDMSQLIKQQNPVVFARKIQQDVFKQLGLTISIGISTNRFLAKMASDMQKPNGITVLTRTNIQDRLWPLPIDKMYSIGKKTAPKLKNIGIMTIRDLALYQNIPLLKTILGKHTINYVANARGVGSNKLNTIPHVLQSVGHSTTLDQDTVDELLLLDYLMNLSKDVAKRAQSKNLVGNNISIILRDYQFNTKTRSVTIDQYINDFAIIYEQATLLFQEHYDHLPIRLVGVSLNNTIPIKDYHHQLSIYDYQTYRK